MLGRLAASATLASRLLLRSHRWGGRRLLPQLLVGLEWLEQQPQLIGAQLLAFRPIEPAQQILQLRLRSLAGERLDFQRRLELADLTGLAVRLALTVPQQALQRLDLRAQRGEFFGGGGGENGVHVGLEYTPTRTPHVMSMRKFRAPAPVSQATAVGTSACAL